MNTTFRTDITVKDICNGFVYNELEGKDVYGLSGKLTIRPEYKYDDTNADRKKDVAVIESILKGYPIREIYFSKSSDDKLEVLFGQQFILSIGRFLTNKFSIIDEGHRRIFDSLADDKKSMILNTIVPIFECEGTESELIEVLKAINIGVPLTHQEKLNAAYSGTFVTLCKEEFGNSHNSNTDRWRFFIKGSAKRQDYLERALDWVSKGNIEGYMSSHRHNTDIDELKTYFNSVIDWAEGQFITIRPDMRVLDWGRLYEAHHKTAYNQKLVDEEVQKLYADSYVIFKKGIFEYVLGGSVDTKLLNVRVFDDATKKSVYSTQTTTAKANGVSNCPLCTVGHDANKSKIWTLKEMDADHVAAWSNGGGTNINNCQMFCLTHNREKGNR